MNRFHLHILFCQRGSSLLTLRSHSIAAGGDASHSAMNQVILLANTHSSGAIQHFRANFQVQAWLRIQRYFP